MPYSPTTVDAKELIGLSAHVYGDASSVPAGWIVIDSRTDSISGLKAVAYQNVFDPLQIAVAIAGTQFTNGGTLDTDGTVLGNNFPQRFSDQLREFLDTVTRDQPKDDQVAITSHPLAGVGVQPSVPYLADRGLSNAH